MSDEVKQTPADSRAEAMQAFEKRVREHLQRFQDFATDSLGDGVLDLICDEEPDMGKTLQHLMDAYVISVVCEEDEALATDAQGNPCPGLGALGPRSGGGK